MRSNYHNSESTVRLIMGVDTSGVGLVSRDTARFQSPVNIQLKNIKISKIKDLYLNYGGNSN